MAKNKLYFILASSCVAGYGWLYVDLNYIHGKSINFCLVKLIMDIPCPSCGCTRSVESLMRGQLLESFLWNPFGILVALIITITPIWLLIDIMLKGDSLLHVYSRSEIILRKKTIAIPLIILVLANWGWNIYKGL